MKFASVATFAFLTSSAFVGAVPVDDLSGGLVLSKRELDMFDDMVELMMRDVLDGATQEDLHKRFELTDGQKEFLSKIYDLLKKFVSNYFNKKNSSAGASATTAPADPVPTGGVPAPTSNDLGAGTTTATTQPSAGAGAAEGILNAIKGAQ